MLGERLKELRKSRKITQVDMSKLLECTDRHYQRIEYGQIDLPMSKLIFLADYFNVSLDYLVGRSNNPEFNKLFMKGFGIMEQNLFNVKEVKQVYNLDEVNNLLKIGWKLIGVYQYSSGGELLPAYVLGIE